MYYRNTTSAEALYIRLKRKKGCWDGASESFLSGRCIPERTVVTDHTVKVEPTLNYNPTSHVDVSIKVL